MNRMTAVNGILKTIVSVAGILALGWILLSVTGRPRSTQAEASVRLTHPPSALAPAPAKSDGVAVGKVGQDVVQIRTEPVEFKALDNKVETTGLVAFPADRTVKIAPRVQGRIRTVFVHVGDLVSEGQTIALLDSSDAAAAISTETQNQANLRLAQATLDQRRAQLRLGTPAVTQAQAAVDQAEATVAFSKNALNKVKIQAKIGGFTQQPLSDAKNSVVNAQAALAQAQADLDTDQHAYDRMVKLVDIGVNSKADLETTRNTLTHAQVTADADRQVLEQAKKTLAREEKAYKSNLYADQQVIAAENSYRQAVLQLQAAERALAITKAATLADFQQAQNGYQNAVAAEQNSRAALKLLGNPDGNGCVAIKSPISGIIVERDVNPGQMVDQSQMLPWQMFIISDNRSVWVEGDIYEKDVAAVHPGEPVSIHVDAYPQRNFSGTVLHVSPTLDPKTRAVKVRAEISNPESLLKDGMFAEMMIATGQSEKATVVPLAAIQHDADTDYVYIRSGQQYVRRNVEVGEQKDDQCIVTSGLHSGEQVVTQGAIFLDGSVNAD